jgi:hypothetical protein
MIMTFSVRRAELVSAIPDDSVMIIAMAVRRVPWADWDGTPQVH